MILDKFIRYRLPIDDDLVGSSFEDLLTRYDYLKALADKVSQENREKYDKIYNNLLTDINRYLTEIHKRLRSTPHRKSDPQTGNYKPNVLDELRALENDVKEKYKIFAEAQDKLADLIHKRIIDRIMQLYERNGNKLVGIDGDVHMYDVQLPFPIEINGDSYRIIQCQKTIKCTTVFLYRYDNGNRVYTHLDADIAYYVFGQLNRMGFWDDNYTFEPGPI